MGAPENEKLTGPRATTSLVSRHSPLAAPHEQLLALRRLGLRDFPDRLRPAPIEIFQVNVGKLCNMACRHCHVDAGPDRTDEMMSRETMELCLAALDRTAASTVDITGGAPELNPHFRYLVEEALRRGKRVIDRCNLTVLLTGPCRDLPQWFAERGVEIVCSLPHYRKRNTDLQRGDGTFEKSIEALRLLNAAGYGRGEARRRLTLVHNPAGAFLAGDQKSMEREWKEGLAANHGVTFDALIALNNMPIARFLEWLQSSGNLERYMELLVNAYNPGTVNGLMCRNTLSVGWDGRLYDCDFNQMLELEVRGPHAHIRDFDPARLATRAIVTGPHCYGCTAGAGSSCGGAIA